MMMRSNKNQQNKLTLHLVLALALLSQSSVGFAGNSYSRPQRADLPAAADELNTKSQKLLTDRASLLEKQTALTGLLASPKANKSTRARVTTLKGEISTLKREISRNEKELTTLTQRFSADLEDRNRQARVDKMLKHSRVATAPSPDGSPTREEEYDRILREAQERLGAIDRGAAAARAQEVSDDAFLDRETKRIEDELQNKAARAHPPASYFNDCEKNMLDYLHSRVNTQSSKESTQEKINAIRTTQKQNLASLIQLLENKKPQCKLEAYEEVKLELRDIMLERTALAIQQNAKGGSWLGSFFSSHSNISRKAQQCAKDWITEFEQKKGKIYAKTTHGKKAQVLANASRTIAIVGQALDAMAITSGKKMNAAAANLEAETRRAAVHTGAVNDMLAVSLGERPDRTAPLLHESSREMMSDPVAITPCGTGYILDGTLGETTARAAVTDRALARDPDSAGVSTPRGAPASSSGRRGR